MSISRMTFFIMVSAWGIVLGLIQWHVYRKGVSFLQPTWTVVLCLLLPLIFLAPHLLVRQISLGLSRVMAAVGGLWLGFFYYSLFVMVLYFLGWIGFLAAGKAQSWTLLAPGWVRIAFGIVLVMVVGGCWNAFHPVYRSVKLQTSAAVMPPVKIAFVTDIHLGTILGKDYMSKLAERLRKVQPDMIIFGGDQIDEDLQMVMQEGSLAAFKTLKAPLGVYAVLGNHDYLGGTPGEEQKALAAEGVQFLVDKTVRLGHHLELTGLSDYSWQKTAAALKPRENQDYRIVIDHQPRRIQKAADLGYDLYLAGHTHAGQLFPNRWVTGKMYLLDYGMKRFADMQAIVSDGYGFWGVPMRVGPAPEIVVITISGTT